MKKSTIEPAIEQEIRRLKAAIVYCFSLALCIAQASAQTSITGGSAQIRYDLVRYDQEYPLIRYGEMATENQIARLQQKIDSGQVRLKWEAGRGYLDSLLKALDIDASSQVLVYSKTSLQIHSIKPSTPRAIYFNDDSYVAWVQNSDLIELSVMDAKMGAVFYTLVNRPDVPVKAEREMNRCLNCHDKFSMLGGGVPRFLLSSRSVDNEGVAHTIEMNRETDDRTPLRERWGGWYVTGKTDGLQHLGNGLDRDAVDSRASSKVQLGKVQRGTPERLTEEFDTTPYLTDKSDIVALLVLEHQLYVKNLITRLNFKARTFVAKDLPASHGNGQDDNVTLAQMSQQTQSVVKGMIDQLVKAMLFAGAAKFPRAVAGTSGFDKWFQSQGPFDKHGRSLRQLDLSTRLFKYPLSYVIYSEGFDALPSYARQYAYQRIAEVLIGNDNSLYGAVAVADRNAILEILVDTKPEFGSEFAKVYSAMQ